LHMLDVIVEITEELDFLLPHLLSPSAVVWLLFFLRKVSNLLKDKKTAEPLSHYSSDNVSYISMIRYLNKYVLISSKST